MFSNIHSGGYCTSNSAPQYQTDHGTLMYRSMTPVKNRSPSIYILITDRIYSLPLQKKSEKIISNLKKKTLNDFQNKNVF